MNTNNTNKNNKLIHPELSYLITGICFEVHNQTGRYAREKQYCNALENKFRALAIPYKRELIVGQTGNRLDFLIDDKIIIEVKAKRIITREDYYQIERYLQILNKPLGLIINFQNRYLKPYRVIRIDTDVRKKYLNSHH